MKQKIITPDIKICYCGSTATIRTWERGHAIVYRVECENNHKLSKFCGTHHRAICRWNNRLTALQNKEYNMSEMKHTKGDWSLMGLIVMSGTEHICDVWSTNKNGVNMPNEESGQANARLISASPDLLEAIVAMKEYCKYHDIRLGSGIIHQLELAISKATGDK